MENVATELTHRGKEKNQVVASLFRT